MAVRDHCNPRTVNVPRTLDAQPRIDVALHRMRERTRMCLSGHRDIDQLHSRQLLQSAYLLQPL